MKLLPNTLNDYEEAKRQALTIEENFLNIRPYIPNEIICAAATNHSIANQDSSDDLKSLLKLTLQQNKKMQEEFQTQISKLNSQVEQLTLQNSNLQPQNVVPQRFNRPRCSKCNKFGHTYQNCRVPFCKYCNKLGHWEINCWSRQPTSVNSRLQGNMQSGRSQNNLN